MLTRLGCAMQSLLGRVEASDGCAAAFRLILAIHLDGGMNMKVAFGGAK
jgi:hypothetical protein